MTTDISLYSSETRSNIWKDKTKLLSVGHNSFDETQSKLPEILFVTSFPPRECGIATYSQDLMNALNEQFLNSFICSICALESFTEQHFYKQQPRYILNTDCRNSFSKVAFNINRNENIKLVVIQHEFGFFATKNEEFQQFFKSISKPVVFVFHTVLPHPNDDLKVNVQEMASIATSIIVMTKSAANILANEYGIDPGLITIIPHGTHLVPPLDKKGLKEYFQLSNRKVLSTFGLLGSSKSIETTLDALPSVIQSHPEVLFLILGKTHPAIVKHEGEKYRRMLEEKVVDLHLEKHVRFVNEYLQLPVLLEYLQLTDIYLFTSKDPNQAVSGTFSYAVSCGCPVISTPIPHAKEVLSDNNGIIIDFENAEQLATSIISLLTNEKLRAEISSNSFHKMASTAWQNSAIAHAILFEQLIANDFELQYSLPKINLSHLHKMTDDFGMFQFSKIAIPDKQSGYTLDDNARALIASCQLYNTYKNHTDIERIKAYVLFIKHCLQPTGLFLNYVDTKRDFTQQNYSENLEDSTGRAIWALGYVSSLKDILPKNITCEAIKLLQIALPHVHKIHSTRAMAFIIKGLHYFNDDTYFNLQQTFANRLIQMYKHERTGDWHWFENYLTYGNSLLPDAMLCAFLSSGNNDYKLVAIESFQFLLSKIFVEGRIKVISNKGWRIKDQIVEAVIGGEQPIDVAYTILALENFFNVFGKDEYEKKASIAFNWFLGDNHLHQIVYNPCTGGCYDGVEEHTVNLNQGAESTVSYLMARLAIERLIKRRAKMEIVEEGNFVTNVLNRGLNYKSVGIW